MNLMTGIPRGNASESARRKLENGSMNLIVGMADCKIAESAGQEISTYALGSCIGLTVYDPASQVGGLLHFMLPDSAIDPERGAGNPYKFADTGIPLLLAGVYARGASKKRLVVRVAGAADMLEIAGGLEIGKRNYLSLRRILWKAGLLIHGEAVGGNQSRTIRLEIGSGNLWLQESSGKREVFPVGMRGGQLWHIAS
jgi:chemotaxis protein CheD